MALQSRLYCVANTDGWRPDTWVVIPVTLLWHPLEVRRPWLLIFAISLFHSSRTAHDHQWRLDHKLKASLSSSVLSAVLYNMCITANYSEFAGLLWDPPFQEKILKYLNALTSGNFSLFSQHSESNPLFSGRAFNVILLFYYFQGKIIEHSNASERTKTKTINKKTHIFYSANLFALVSFQLTMQVFFMLCCHWWAFWLLLSLFFAVWTFPHISNCKHALWYHKC